MTSTAIPSPAAAAAERLDALIPRLVAVRARIAALQAEELALMAEADAAASEWQQAEGSFRASEAEFPHRSTAAEIAAAWRVSDRSVQRQLAEATLCAGFGETLASLRAGRISLAHVRVIADAGARIVEPAMRAEYEAAVLPFAEAESAARLKPVARRRAEWFLDETIDDRHQAARKTRTLYVTDLDDGMAELTLQGPAVIVHGIADRVTGMAREVEDDPTVGDVRCLDERRFDLAADLLLAAAPTAHVAASGTDLGAIRASVQVTVPVLTLIGSLEADPFDAARLAGHGPIDPTTARRLTESAPGWDRILTHPVTGTVLAVDRYQPSTEMRRHLRVRDQHCRFPGCRIPIGKTDLDHTLDHQYGGPTEVKNLAHLCRRHHTLKHQTAWQVAQRSDGTLKWTSPTGRSYPDTPTSRVMFTTDEEFDAARSDPPPF